MKKKDDRGPIRKYHRYWYAVSNYGNVCSVSPTRREALRMAQEHTGQPWSECRAYMEIRKVELIEVPASRR